MIKRILIFLDILHSEGAENVAVSIAVKLKESDEYAPIVVVSRSGGVLEETLQNHQIDYIILGRKHTYDISKFFIVREIIKEKQISLIHSHKIGSNFWACILGRLCGIPVIAHVHGQEYNLKGLLINRFIGACSTRLITVSDYEKKELVKQGIPLSKIITIRNGVNLDKYRREPNLEEKRKLGLGPETEIIGISAALRDEKKHSTFLLAAREICKKRKNTYFMIIGDGVKRNGLEHLASELRISDHCIFTGFINNIPDILSILNVGVLTSEREGLPMTLLEYMASSKPIVSTNVGGIGEVIKDGFNGYLVSRGDYKMLAEKINILLENKGLASELGRNGLSFATECLSDDVMINNIKSVYSDIISNTPE